MDAEYKEIQRKMLADELKEAQIEAEMIGTNENDRQDIAQYVADNKFLMSKVDNLLVGNGAVKIGTDED